VSLAILACPVCIGAGVQNAAAFGATTVFLSALPLGMVAAVVGYLRRRAKRRDESTPA